MTKKYIKISENYEIILGELYEKNAINSETWEILKNLIFEQDSKNTLLSKEDKIIANRKYAKKHYEKNREEICRKRRERYKKNKKMT